MDTPKYVLKFNEGFMVPKKESLAKDIVKVLLLIYGIGFIIAWFIMGSDIFKEIPVVTWLCVILAVTFIRQQGGYVRKPSPCELWFFDDYMVQYCERRYYKKNNIRKEYYKFYYKDIKRCLYRTVVNKIDMIGIVEATFYKYDKDGNIIEKPCHHITADSISVFYTVFEPDIDFVKEIEEHSPIKVEFENS